MKHLAAAAAVLGLSVVTPALAAPAFYGTWSCAMVVDNTVATDWTREAYGADGVSVGPEAKPTPVKVRAIRKGVFDLAYADGGRSRLVMKEPWMFVRSTMEHSYLCVRKGP